MKKLTILLVVIVALAFFGSAMAVPATKTLEFKTPMGTVTFNGKTHADKGLKCADCHPKIFQYKKGSFKMTEADHVPGKLCGTCHDGTKAFAQTKDNCNKCHKKAAGGY